MAETVQIKTTLQDYHQSLEDALLDLKTSTESKLAKKILELESPKAKILMEDCALVGNIEAINSRLCYLDRKELEEQDIEGQNELQHIYRSSWPTPSFSFDLKVRFPIREHGETISKGSKWKTLLCELGGYTFTGVLVNPRFADAYAKVTLWGWRKEIFASEIEELKMSLIKKKAERAALGKRRVQVEAALKTDLHQAKLNLSVNHFVKDLDSMTKLNRVSAKRSSFPKDTLRFLDAGTISGLAQYYGLVSFVNKNEGGRSKLSVGVQRLIEGYKVELDSVLQRIKGSKATYNDFSSESISSSHKFLASFEGTKADSPVNSQQPQDPSVVDFRAMGSIEEHTAAKDSDPTLEALCKSARSDLTNIRAWTSSQDGVVSRFKAEAAELEQEFERRRNARAQRDVPNFDKNIKLTEIDEEAWRLAAKAMRDELRHIGIFAALRYEPKMGAAWMSVFRGMKVFVIREPKKITAVKKKKKNRRKGKRN